MRLLLVALLLGSLLQVAQVPATAAPVERDQAALPVQQTPSAQMSVRAGFDGLGKVGGWLPVEVEIRNDGPDIDGEIQIVVTDTTVSRGTYTRAPAVYTAPAILPRRSHKRIMLEAELRMTGQKMQARLVEGGTVISEQDVQLTRVAAGDLLCGVLSRSGPSFDFLPTLELPPPLRRARIAHVEVEDLATRPQVLASLDCIIFDNIATTTMLDSQRDALTSWVYGGGLLVAIGGPTWQKTFSALPADLLPVKANGLVSLESLDALADIGGEPIKDAGPWLVSQATLTDGNLVAEQDGVPLIAAARRGSGTVLYLAMDPTVEPLRSWAGTPRLWRYVLAHGAGGVGLSSAVSATFAGWGRIPRNAMVDISALNGPSPGPDDAGAGDLRRRRRSAQLPVPAALRAAGLVGGHDPAHHGPRRDRDVHAGRRLPRQRRDRQQGRAGAGVPERPGLRADVRQRALAAAGQPVGARQRHRADQQPVPPVPA